MSNGKAGYTASKGHVIRRNLAQRYGLADLKGIGPDQDPWELLFAAAKKNRPADANDLVPFWMFEAEGRGFKIEREIPVLPLSREIGRIAPLKRALALYRAVMGQPRQQELVEFLARTLDEGDLQPLMHELVVDLSPPKR